MIRYILAALLLATPALAQTGNVSGASVTAAGGGQTNTLANWLQGMTISTVNKTLAGTWTANSYAPTSATIPTNGMYLPAANTLGWAINSAAEVQLTSNALSPAVSGGSVLGTTSLPWGGMVTANAAGLNFLQTTGPSASGFTVTSGNVFQWNGTGPGGSASNILYNTLGSATSQLVSSRKFYVLSTNQTVDATPWFSVATSPTGAAPSGGVRYNSFLINSDTVDATAATGSGTLGTYIGHTVSAGAIGGRTALHSFLNIVGDVTTVETPGGAGRFYVSSGAHAQASASAGGTAGVGNAKGNLFGANYATRLTTGAGMYWNSIVGGEVDIGTVAGTQAVYKIGHQVVHWADDATPGTAGADVAYNITSQEGPAISGHDRGLNFGHPLGQWAMKSTSTLIGTLATAVTSPAYAAAYGMDFSAVTFSSAFLKSTGFEVDGTGKTKASTLSTGAASLTLTAGAVGMSTMTASASAPGAAGGKLELVCGTVPGTAKLIIYAGTSTTATTIADNVGGGVTGC